MANELMAISSQYTDIKSKIFTIRGIQVMIDRDLAQLYGIETKRINEAVRRNKLRFPANFVFQLNNNEKNELVANCDQFEILKHSSTNPYAFTEHGVAMLASVLSSQKAILINIHIINTFIYMRKFLISNAQIFRRLDRVELKQLKTDEQLTQVFKAMEQNQTNHNQGIFFGGQVFDAYSFVSGLIRKAKKSITIVDNYIDDRVLKLLTKRNKNVSATIYTKSINKTLSVDLEKHNAQYTPIIIKEIKTFHDRFIILDETEIYHIGASLKDLGLKCFAFSKLDIKSIELINKLN
jgi:hypothetical protein